MSNKKPLIAYISDTHKPLNQDSGKEFSNENLNLFGIVVADGIGSLMKSEVASQFVVEKFAEILGNLTHFEELDFNNIFSKTKSDFIEFVKSDKELKNLNIETSLGTTVICVISLPDEFIVAYAGNGSVWHVRGDINEFPPHYLLPWNSCNHLSPHSFPEKGKPALFNYLSVSENNMFQPTIVRISKEKNFSQTVILATDGVYAFDSEVCGQGDDGNVWIPGGRNLLKMYEFLKPIFKNNEATDIELKDAMKSFVQYMKDEGLMDDDTTIGVIMEKKQLPNDFDIERKKAVQILETLQQYTPDFWKEDCEQLISELKENIQSGSFDLHDFENRIEKARDKKSHDLESFELYNSKWLKKSSNKERFDAEIKNKYLSFSDFKVFIESLDSAKSGFFDFFKK